MITAAVVSQGRSGTYMLCSALERHSLVEFCSWPPAYGEDPWEMLDSFLGDVSHRPVRVVATHQWGASFVEWSFGMDLDTFWRVFGCKFCKSVVLNRENQLSAMVSQDLQAIGYGVDQYRKRMITPPRIRADPMRLREFVRARRDLAERARAALPDQLAVTYEEMVRDWECVLFRVLNHLELPFEQLEPRTVKQETRALCEVISNFEELKMICTHEWSEWCEA